MSGQVETKERTEMKKVLTLAVVAMVMAPTLATAQTPPSPTKALVNIIVAEQFCNLHTPRDIHLAIGQEAMRETGLDAPRLVDAGYWAATEIGNAYRADGRLPKFCAYMMGVYAGSGW